MTAFPPPLTSGPGVTVSFPDQSGNEDVSFPDQSGNKDVSFPDQSGNETTSYAETVFGLANAMCDWMLIVGCNCNMSQLSLGRK